MHNFNYWMIQLLPPWCLCKTLCQFGSYKEMLASMWITDKTDSHSSLSQGPGALAPPSEASPISYRAHSPFPKIWGIVPYRACRVISPLAAWYRLVWSLSDSTPVEEEEPVTIIGHLGALWCLPLSGVGTWQPLGKMVSTSPLCQEAADWGPVHKAAVWQPRPEAQSSAIRRQLRKQFSQGQSLLENYSPRLPAS